MNLTRRLFGPVGACCAFLFVITLVIGGLGWVTIAALSVEQSQFEARAAADRASKERLALWRLDGLMLPIVGLENNRPFAHYTALHAAFPAVDIEQEFNNNVSLRLPSPLLSADLPAWMSLHFQIDPETGWDSPQVLPADVAERLQGAPNFLSLANITPERADKLQQLRTLFPEESVLRTLADRDRAVSDESLFVIPVPLTNDASIPKRRGWRAGEPEPGQYRGPGMRFDPYQPTNRDTVLSPNAAAGSGRSNTTVFNDIPAPMVQEINPTRNNPTEMNVGNSLNPQSQAQASPALMAKNNSRIGNPDAINDEFDARQRATRQNLDRTRTYEPQQTKGAATNPMQLGANPQGLAQQNADKNDALNLDRKAQQDQLKAVPQQEMKKAAPEAKAALEANPAMKQMKEAAPPAPAPVVPTGPAPITPAAPAPTMIPRTAQPAAPTTAPGQGMPSSAGGFPGGPDAFAGGPGGFPGRAEGAPRGLGGLGGSTQPAPGGMPGMGGVGIGGRMSGGMSGGMTGMIGGGLPGVVGGAGFSGGGFGGSGFGGGTGMGGGFSGMGGFPGGPGGFDNGFGGAGAAPGPGGFGGGGRGGVGMATKPPAAKPAGELPATQPASGPQEPDTAKREKAKLQVGDKEQLEIIDHGQTPSGAPLPDPNFLAARGSRKAAPTVHPVAVHVGPLHPEWLTATDGTEILVLVRSAQLENKTVYQGVLLDWKQIQQTLTEQVVDLFPAATIAPVHNPNERSPERAMTVLPVQLDTGVPPQLPAAGLTPLRLGLLLAWIASVIALTAVGFGGRSLLDLSERRIRFVSAVTHELRTPLTSLRLYLDLLTSGMIEDPEQQKQYLHTLSDQSERLNRLIENVLDFARLEKRSVQATRQPTNVSEMLDQLRQTWQDRCQAEGKDLVVVSTVPATQLVSTDARMATQILGNLIDNARKYSRDAEDNRIWVWAKPGERGRVLFEVEDRGPGVPTRERRLIFRPFRRGEIADTTAGGAGLGLALAQHWAELLGGRLSYRVADGGTGACFRLELPAAHPLKAV